MNEKTVTNAGAACWKTERARQEAAEFTEKGSCAAVRYFTGVCPMSTEGFALCIREMIRLELDRLYEEFAACNRSFLETFNRESEKRALESGEQLSKADQARIWTEIEDKLREI